MSIASLIKKSIGLSVFGLFAACPLPPEPAGGVSFEYVLVVPDGNGGAVAAINCADAGVTTVKFNIGNDDDANGVLDAVENITQLQQDCNQADADADGLLEAGEFGVFTSDFDIDAGTFGAISIEFLNANQNVAWRTFDAVTPADVFSFIGDTTIVDQQILILPFLGDINTQVADELQVFLGGL